MARQNVWISSKEASELLGISVATLRNWVRVGRILPAHRQGRRWIYDRDHVLKEKKRLVQRGDRLQSRRNKRGKTGYQVPRQYIQNDNNVKITQELVGALGQRRVSDKTIRAILAYFAREQVEARATAEGWDQERIQAFAPFIDALRGKNPAAIEERAWFAKMLGARTTYEPGDDFLGLVYLSVTSLEKRKANGMYYSPIEMVKDAIGMLGPVRRQSRVIDPCCGGGNFLLQYVLGRDAGSGGRCTMEMIHGRDIDPISVDICRFNLALLYGQADFDLLTKQIQCKNSLLETFDIDFDLVLGNPPWGSVVLPKDRQQLNDRYTLCNGKSTDVFTLFLEQGARILAESGKWALIVPEALLTTNKHKTACCYLKQRGRIERVQYHGHRFPDVSSPCVTLHWNKSQPFSTKGVHVHTEAGYHRVGEEREGHFAFRYDISNPAYAIVNKMEAVERVDLAGHTTFAMGVVTGNNQAFLTPLGHGESEPVIRGRDLKRYSVEEQMGIRFEPNLFQQVAPEPLYRAEEKLVYRFIGEGLTFAYDRSQRVTLNSCNILIPHIPGVTILTLLALLNSKAVQFYYQNRFRSVKVLRQFIEDLPLPLGTEVQRARLHDLCSCRLQEVDVTSHLQVEEEIDHLVYQMYALSHGDIDYINQNV